MAALVQSYPQQSSTVTMLQTRPSSASGILQTSQNQPHHPYPLNTQAQRHGFHALHGSISASNYRGHSAITPIAPYAFTSTPNLTSTRKEAGAQMQADHSISHAPVMPHFQRAESDSTIPRTRYPAPASVSTTSSTSSDSSAASHKLGSKDDSFIVNTARAVSGLTRPQSTIITSTTEQKSIPDAVLQSTKSVPDRYRRPNNRRAESSGNGPQVLAPTSSDSLLVNTVKFNSSDPNMPSVSMGSFQSFSLQMPQISGLQMVTANTVNDSMENTHTRMESLQEHSKRYRRRSIHTVTPDHAKANAAGLLQQGARQVSSANGRIDHSQQMSVNQMFDLPTPQVHHGRQSSAESVRSARSGHSRHSSANKRDTSLSAADPTPSSPSQSLMGNPLSEQPQIKHDIPRLVNIPPRSSSTDAAQRIANPSPLSKPVTMSAESSTTKDSFASAVNAALQQPSKPTYAQVANGTSGSPAAQQLAALNDKEGKKSKTSRLRRAFSFGSAAELRRASAENSAAANNTAERARLRKEKYQDEQEAEQARIAQQQEAGGLGSGIYSGQGNFFGGSTDNLSISSTASSASVMIRKMGKGMKKSTRSLVGLFRPKSVIGVPAADSAFPQQASQAQVSMVTVEAEREKVNVHASPLDQVGGGTGFPKLERNSIDAANANNAAVDRLGSSGTETSVRRSIVGGENERAEVLAAVKKGILKRSGTDSGNNSPIIKPVDHKPNFQLPHIPVVNDSPNSSAPSTPNDDQQGHRRTGSVTIGGEDYFMSALRFQGSKSTPGTPQTNSAKRNATFSPRIQFHDTWPSGEYDRRGEIATCNRLTPMLAQQIKEELNTFKMEMEVHENSKIYTHFF